MNKQPYSQPLLTRHGAQKALAAKTAGECALLLVLSEGLAPGVELTIRNVGTNVALTRRRYKGVKSRRSISDFGFRLSDLTGVLVRLRHSFHASLAAWDDENYKRAKWSALLYGFLNALPCPVINRPRPGAGQRLPEDLRVAAALGQAGFCLSPTLLTGSPDPARRFFERHGRRALCTSPE